MDRSTHPDASTLRRIVAVLLALADLAERAGGRSVAVRGIVLWLLRSAEIVAREHVSGLTGDAADEPGPAPFTHEGATEAIRLAASFRRLAAALVALSAEFPASPPQAVAARSHPPAAKGMFTAFGAASIAAGRLDSS